MLTSDQAKVITEVYRRFLDSEHQREWDDLDEQLEMSEWLNTEELTKEAEILMMNHKDAKPRCKLNHAEKDCFVPVIIEAVSHILSLYHETGYMSPRNKYVLQYYLALTGTGFIVLD
jgi:hypothetical protein